MRNTYLLLLLTLTSCQNSTQSFNINASRDTTISIKRKSSYTTQMRVIIKGEIQNNCIIILKEGKRPDSLTLKRVYVLESGIVNDTLGSSDIYADWGDIIFKHQNNTKGSLKLDIKF